MKIWNHLLEQTPKSIKNDQATIEQNTREERNLTWFSSMVYVWGRRKRDSLYQNVVTKFWWKLENTQTLIPIHPISHWRPLPLNLTLDLSTQVCVCVCIHTEERKVRPSLHHRPLQKFLKIFLCLVDRAGSQIRFGSWIQATHNRRSQGSSSFVEVNWMSTPGLVDLPATRLVQLSLLVTQSTYTFMIVKLSLKYP